MGGKNYQEGKRMISTKFRWEGQELRASGVISWQCLLHS